MELPPLVDPLGEALHSLRMGGTFYCRSEFSAPWGVTMPPSAGTLWFHVLVAGRCTLVVRDERLELTSGDLVVVPHGDGHRLWDRAGVPTPDVIALPQDYASERYSLLRYGGGGAPTTLMCGLVRFDHPAARSLVERLPAAIHVAAGDAPHADWMQSTLRLMAAEARSMRPGGETVMTRLSDVLVIQAIRAWIERDPAARTGWLGALQDPQVGRVIGLVHRDPSRPWTLATMAAEAAMSRSAFAERFSRLVGEPPMAYVTRWRMHLAHGELADGTATAAQLAGRLGYQSEAAFGRAFKRVVGVPPGSVRRGAGAPVSVGSA